MIFLELDPRAVRLTKGMENAMQFMSIIDVSREAGRSKARLAATLAGAALAAMTGALARAASVCPIPLGWFESKNLDPFFLDPSGPTPTTDCDFQLWSWSAFVHWMRTDPATGQPFFLSLPTFDDLLSRDSARAEIGPRPLMLKPRALKPKTFGEIEQAGSNGVLIDQQGRAVYYSTHMNKAYFDFTKSYFGHAKYDDAAPTLDYPIRATVLKASWRIVPPGDDAGNAFTTTATIDLLESDGKGGLKPSGKTQPNVKVALVGVHVVGVIKDHPEFVWATFERDDNAPNLPAGIDPQSPKPVSERSFTFYKGGTPANQSNVLAKELKIDEASQRITPITEVFRQFAYGGASAERVADIDATNAEFKQGILESPKIEKSFADYRLIGAVWLNAGALQPGDCNIDRIAVASVDLANSTLETFVQGRGTNCFSCHNTGAVSGFPGKNINLSHAITFGAKKVP